MEIKKAIETLEGSDEFKHWKKSHEDNYLADAFIIVDENGKTEWQVGYYDKKSDKITVFLTGEKVVAKPEEEVFKKDGIVKSLDLGKVKKDLKEALEICRDLFSKKYTSEITLKTIVVLQHIDIGQVWNMTCITNKYNTINVKVDSETGKVISHSLISMFDFVQK